MIKSYIRELPVTYFSSGNKMAELHFFTCFFPKTESIYSLRPKLWTKCCFMKQNCHLQRGVVRCKNVASPLSSKGFIKQHLVQSFGLRLYSTYIVVKHTTRKEGEVTILTQGKRFNLQIKIETFFLVGQFAFTLPFYVLVFVFLTYCSF